MKILIYGAGVVGCAYGWQLSKAGCDVTVLVRKGQKRALYKKMVFTLFVLTLERKKEKIQI